MTTRILAGFLGVLLALIVLLVVPLGIKVSSQQAHDFRASAAAEARALASNDEERLGDTGEAAHRRPVAAPPVTTGEGVVVLGGHGQVLVRAGQLVPESAIRAVRAGTTPGANDAVVVTAPVGDADKPDGTVVLLRDVQPLERRTSALWVALVTAAIVTLALGAATAAGLARWIARPLRGLQSAATRMGHGDVAARTDAKSGPPEMKAVATAFNEMAERLTTLLDGQRRMTADVSHQLRTPLAALQLRLELLAEDSAAGTRAELLDALREIGRLNRLLDGLLAAARAQVVTAEPDLVDVDEVAAERVQMWEPVAQENGVLLSSSLEPATAVITPGHLEQVLDNLLANAVDALSAGDHVSVSVRAAADAVELVVSDDGPGMPLPRRQSPLSRFEGDGDGRKAGLGLAIVAGLVASDRGSVALEETPGGGLTVVVRLPIATAQHAVPRPQADESPQWCEPPDVDAAGVGGGAGRDA